MREYNTRNREKVTARRRARWHTTKYGLTDEERDSLFARFDGLCAVCRVEPATVIDHSHDSGEVRAALCHVCNKGLGFAEKIGLETMENYLSIKPEIPGQLSLFAAA